jgi:hypothetical protein
MDDLLEKESEIANLYHRFQKETYRVEKWKRRYDDIEANGSKINYDLRDKCMVYLEIIEELRKRRPDRVRVNQLLKKGNIIP